MSDTRTERQPDGKLAAWISADGDRVFFRQVGEWFASDLGAEAYERFDAMGQIFWDFAVAGDRVTLLWDRQRGIAVVCSATTAQNEALVLGIADRLRARVDAERAGRARP